MQIKVNLFLSFRLEDVNPVVWEMLRIRHRMNTLALRKKIMSVKFILKLIHYDIDSHFLLPKVNVCQDYSNIYIKKSSNVSWMCCYKEFFADAFCT